MTRTRTSRMAAITATAPTKATTGSPCPSEPGSTSSAWTSAVTVGSWTIDSPPWNLSPASKAKPTKALPDSPMAAKRTPATIWPYTGEFAPSTTAFPAQTKRAIRVQLPPKSMEGRAVATGRTGRNGLVVSFARCAPGVHEGGGNQVPDDCSQLEEEPAPRRGVGSRVGPTLNFLVPLQVVVDDLAADVHEVLDPGGVRDHPAAADRIDGHAPLRHRGVIHFLNGGVQMEREADEGGRTRNGGGVIRHVGVGEVPRGEIEGPAPIVGSRRACDWARGPVRFQVDLLVQGIDPVEVVGESAGRAVVHAAVICDVVPRVVVAVFDDRIESHGVEGVDLERNVLGHAPVLRVHGLRESEIAGLDRDEIDVVRVCRRPIDDPKGGIVPEPDEHMVPAAKDRRRAGLFDEFVVDESGPMDDRGPEHRGEPRGEETQCGENGFGVHGGRTSGKPTLRKDLLNPSLRNSFPISFYPPNRWPFFRTRRWRRMTHAKGS